MTEPDAKLVVGHLVDEDDLTVYVNAEQLAEFLRRHKYARADRIAERLDNLARESREDPTRHRIAVATE